MKQKFSNYVCVGDSISWEKNGFVITASLHYDSDITPDDYDCYDEDTKKQWMSDEWFFGGIILSVSKNDVVISENAASVWGLECNITDNNDYLTEVSYELEDEALNFARKEMKRIIDSSNDVLGD